MPTISEVATGNAGYMRYNAIIKTRHNHMRTLADVKRKMELGSNWHCVRLSGGNEDMGVREVGKVQGNAVAFLSGGKLWWPKAKDVQVQGNSFTIFRNGKPALRYTLVEQAPQTVSTK
jgi:hypothetical protein